MRRVREALKPTRVRVYIGEDCRSESCERAFQVELSEEGDVDEVIRSLGDFLRREMRGDAFVILRFIELERSGP
jgi:hypothetical protein